MVVLDGRIINAEKTLHSEKAGQSDTLYRYLILAKFHPVTGHESPEEE
jgi:hypothetical protein